MEEIIRKLNILRAKYPEQEDQTILNDWEVSTKTALITAKLQENDAVKLIIKKYTEELVRLNRILSTDQSLFKDEDGRHLGLLIHAQKNFYIKFLKMFSSAQSLVDSMERTIDNELNDED